MVRIYDASVLRFCGAAGFEFERLMTLCMKCPPTPMEIHNDSNIVLVFARYRKELGILLANSLLFRGKSWHYRKLASRNRRLGPPRLPRFSNRGRYDDFRKHR